jgi:hypothetical protein
VGSPESAATQFFRGQEFLEAFPPDLQEQWQQSLGEDVTAEGPDKAELAAASDPPAGNLTQRVPYHYIRYRTDFRSKETWTKYTPLT